MAGFGQKMPVGVIVQIPTSMAAALKKYMDMTRKDLAGFIKDACLFYQVLLDERQKGSSVVVRQKDGTEYFLFKD